MSPTIDDALRVYFAQSQTQIEKLNEYLRGLTQFTRAEQVFDQAGAAAVQRRAMTASAFTILQKQVRDYYAAPSGAARSEGRRLGNEGGREGKSRWSAYT